MYGGVGANVDFFQTGLIGFFILYGILQERIMTIPYGDPPVMFTRYNMNHELS